MAWEDWILTMKYFDPKVVVKFRKCSALGQSLPYHTLTMRQAIGSNRNLNYEPLMR